MPHNLTLEQLEDKSTGLFSLGFEYLLASIALEYVESPRRKGEFFDNATDFSKKNTLDVPLLVSFPFYIATASDCSEYLYAFLGPFNNSPIGPVSKSAQDLIANMNPTSALQYFSIRSFGIELLPAAQYHSKDITEVLQQIKEDIKSKQVYLGPEPGPFKYFRIKSDLQKMDEGIMVDNYRSDDTEPERKWIPLYRAIDSGVNAIKAQSSGSFFDGELQRIIYQSKYFREVAKAFRNNGKEQLNYQSIEPPERRPFYAERIAH